MANDVEKRLVFKCSEFRHVNKNSSKKRTWKSLKQIIAYDRSLPWPDNSVLYYTINAPPTFKPTKKYSDISGLSAPYIDRHSKLFYSNAEEYSTIRSLPMDIAAGYLQLRGANSLVG